MTSLHYHLMFSTKNREPLIAEHWRWRLLSFLGGTVRTQDGVAEAIGGTGDHVHLLVGLKATHCVADVIKEIKVSSLLWISEEIGVERFAWQEGYGAFTVSPSNVSKVKQYVLHQEDHHRKKSFKEEYMVFLKQSGVEFDERYLW